MNKLTRKIDLNEEQILKENKIKHSLRNNINYNITKINEILNIHDFPSEYNFFDDTNITKVVKIKGHVVVVGLLLQLQLWLIDMKKNMK